MSLFKLKHLWIQSFPEEFDEKHLSVGKIDNKPCIALGSFSGYLRVWIMTSKTGNVGELIYENKFESEIICVHHITNPEVRYHNTIGVLFYRKFMYVSFSKNPSNQTYEVKTIQLSTDPGFSIEGESLSLMTLNSSIQYLNPLSSQPLKNSSPIYPFARKDNCLYYADGEELVMMQNSGEQWRIVVGPMRSIFIFQCWVIVIGDNSIWEIENSSISKTKYIEDDISCGNIIDKGTDYNIIIADYSNKILIYTSTYRLIWALKCDEVPICIMVIKGDGGASDFEGSLAILGEDGGICLAYLGTEVSEVEIDKVDEDIDMTVVESETKKLMESMQNKEDSPAQNNQESVEQHDIKFNLRAKAPRKTTQVLDNDHLYYKREGDLWCCEIECVIRPEDKPIHDVSVTLQLPSNIYCIDICKRFVSIQGTEKFEFILFCSCEKFPYENIVEGRLRYQNSDKSQGNSVMLQLCELPFSFQCNLKSLELEEKPSNKIVLKAANELPAVNESEEEFSIIFNEFEDRLGASKNLTIELANGVYCSMGYNKNNSKVKLESNVFSALCYMFVVFANRLGVLIRDRKVENNELTVDIPLEEFIGIIKEHSELRAAFKKNTFDLEHKCEEFRNIEKKLLTKMKEKTSTLNSIDKVLEYSYRKLIKSADELEQTREELELINHNLEISIKFITELLFLKSKGTAKCRQKVLGIIGYESEGIEFGWEEKVMSCSAFFLNKKFNYTTDQYSFDQLYKTILWVISKVNSGEWNS